MPRSTSKESIEPILNMKQGKFNSIEEKRKFLRSRSKERSLEKDAQGISRAETKEKDDNQQSRTITQIVQGGTPN